MKNKAMGRPRNSAGRWGWNGRRARVARRSRDLSLRDVAEALGVSVSTVARWETSVDDGGNEPTAAQASALAKLLGVQRGDIGTKRGKKSRKGSSAKRAGRV